MTKFLTEGLLSQINRVKHLIAAYNRLPGGVGVKSISLMKTDIRKAEKAIIIGDVMQMLMYFKKLKYCK